MKNIIEPIVYDMLTSYPFIEHDLDALTLYELISAIVDRLNKVVTKVNEFEDPEELVRETLNEWLADGTIEGIIDDITNGWLQDGTIEGMIDKNIPSHVTEWLDKNITNPSSPPIDKSLTVSNAAADAKVTGDRTLMALRSINLTLTTSNVPSTYPDLKSFANASMIAVTGGASSLLSDSPYDGTAYYLITGKVGAVSSSGMHFQIALPYASNVHLMAIRTENLSDSTYSNWQYLYKYIRPSENANDDKRDIITYHLNQLGRVVLPEGDFYLNSNITMPEGSTLEGSGNNTRLIVKHKSGDFNYGIQMASNCTVSNLMIIGDTELDDNPATTPETEYVYGIGWAGSTRRGGKVINCNFESLDRAGIVCLSTGGSTNSGLLVTDCIIRRCYYGVLISANSEYNRISDSKIIGCHWGIMNRAGNTNIVNCGVDFNTIGIEFNTEQGTNPGHGMISDNTINHSQPNNTGYGIIIRGGGGNDVITGNSMYYSHVLFDHTDGNVFSGNNVRFNNIYVVGGNTSLITGNMFHVNSHIYVSENATPKINNNWRWNGTEVVAETE